VRRGAGVNASDRVMITWSDATIKQTWLQVTIRSNDNTGLATSDVFYFGNLVAEVASPSTTVAEVNNSDLVAIIVGYASYYHWWHRRRHARR
jgi:hypothetical protein